MPVFVDIVIHLQTHDSVCEALGMNKTWSPPKRWNSAVQENILNDGSILCGPIQQS